MGRAGRRVRSFCIDEPQLGSKSAAVIQSREVATNQGFLSTILNGDAVGTEVSGRYRLGSRSLEVVAKRGSTVYRFIVASSDCSVDDLYQSR